MCYPALLKQGEAGDPKDETKDAISDHNAIRDAVTEARKHPVGTRPWFDAVSNARTENGKHLDEEEREAMPDSHQEHQRTDRHALAMQWLRFYHQHPAGAPVATADKNADVYLKQHS